MFNKLIFACLVLSVSVTIVLGQTIPPELYKASTIPDPLKENANAVIRYSDTRVNVTGPGKATLKFHSITTILNEKGDSEAVMAMAYNRKYDTYSKIEMRIYDEKGSVIKKYHKDDMYDGSAADDETLVTNDRFLSVKHVIASYPTTVEITYEEDINSFISLDSWRIQSAAELSVQNSTYELTVDPSLGFRYKNEHTTLIPVKEVKEGADTYSWEVKNLAAIKREDNTLPWTVLPDVLFSVNSFNCYGYVGDITSWQSFGKWIQGLNEGRFTLSPERVAALKNMTKDLTTNKDKARFLYNYMQKNMRYVSVQLGIGGFKPFAASFVDDKKYGDCKALSNYMKALLKAVNINSYYAIIRAGANEKPADPAFPYNAFNHAILCVPFKNDTTWLECTSSTQPFGKLGPFTENRNALLITEDGGKLVNTPASIMQDNQFNSEIHVSLSADGGAKVDLKIVGTGVYRSSLLRKEYLKVDEQKEAFIKELNMKQPISFDLNPSTDIDGAKEIKINLVYDKFCDITASGKLFYKPQVINLCDISVPEEEARKNDFYFNVPFQKSCVTSIDLPEGFVVETLPTKQTVNFAYGNYEVDYVYDEAKNQVVSTAKFNLNSRVIPAAKYAELQQFLGAIAKAQNKKLVIKHKA